MAKVQGNDKPVALVTGSVAPRVGRVVAEHLARRGYRLALHSHRPIPESQRHWHQPAMESDELLWLSGPVESERDVESWVGAIGDHFGRIDAVVACAAIWDAAPLVETSVELMRRQWEVNVLGSFLIAKHFGLAMTRQEQGGSLVLVGEWACDRPFAGQVGDVVAVGAIPTLTRTLAIELAERNPRVRVNAILPGPILMQPGVSPEVTRALVEQSLVQREGTPDDFAQAACFLIEQSFTTGHCLALEGGRLIRSGPVSDGLAHPVHRHGNST
ncbi:MAG: SDR family NAD(P)-dependent oxidoreductase [Pirellulaceae bacterium]